MAEFTPVPVESVDDFVSWLTDHGASEGELWVEIYKKSSKRQTVTFDELLNAAICHGWIDVKTQSIDELRYAIRFVPRKPGSNWSEPNRERVRRLLADGAMTAAGIALLPPDLRNGLDGGS